MAGNSLSLLPRPPFALLARVKSLFSSLSIACEAQTHFRSSLLSLFFGGEKRRPEMRLRFAGYPFERLVPRAQAMETMPGLISLSRLKDLHR